jgi:hypothetical protein
MWSGHKNDLLPKEKVTWKFSPTKIALVLVKILYYFGAKAIGNLYRYFIFMSPPLSGRDI